MQKSEFAKIKAELEMRLARAEDERDALRYTLANGRTPVFSVTKAVYSTISGRQVGEYKLDLYVPLRANGGYVIAYSRSIRETYSEAFTYDDAWSLCKAPSCFDKDVILALQQASAEYNAKLVDERLKDENGW